MQKAHESTRNGLHKLYTVATHSPMYWSFMLLASN